jgi:hypothetical protein
MFAPPLVVCAIIGVIVAELEPWSWLRRYLPTDMVPKKTRLHLSRVYPGFSSGVKPSGLVCARGTCRSFESRHLALFKPEAVTSLLRRRGEGFGRDSLHEAFILDLFSRDQPDTFINPNRHGHRWDLNSKFLVHIINVYLRHEDFLVETGAAANRSGQSCSHNVGILCQPSGLSLYTLWSRS